MKVLFLVPQANADVVRSKLASLLGMGWGAQSHFGILAIPDDQLRNQGINTKRVLAELERGWKQVVVSKDVTVNDDALNQQEVEVTTKRTRDIESQSYLAHLVDGYAIGWKKQQIERIGSWFHAVVNQHSVDIWLNQFKALGRPEVGEFLLKQFELVPEHKISEKIAVDSDISNLVDGNFFIALLSNPDAIGTAGKSHSVLSNLIRKRLGGQIRILDITSAIEAADDSTPIVVIEDGLYSATEIIGVLDSLRGLRGVNSSRSEKVRALTDPSILGTRKIILKFGVLYDFGEALLKYYLRYHKLEENILIAEPLLSRRALLTEIGHDLYSFLIVNPVNSDALPKRVAQWLEAFIAPEVFKDNSGGMRASAVGFCREVGGQLWRQYCLKRQWDMSNWPSERIDRCSLGMRGMGLALGFSHSLPKASLPLYWATGSVEFNGKEIPWIPLFNNANSD